MKRERTKVGVHSEELIRSAVVGVSTESSHHDSCSHQGFVDDGEADHVDERTERDRDGGDCASPEQVLKSEVVVVARHHHRDHASKSETQIEPRIHISNSGITESVDSSASQEGGSTYKSN